MHRNKLSLCLCWLSGPPLPPQAQILPEKPTDWIAAWSSGSYGEAMFCQRLWWGTNLVRIAVGQCHINFSNCHKIVFVVNRETHLEDSFLLSKWWLKIETTHPMAFTIPDVQFRIGQNHAVAFSKYLGYCELQWGLSLVSLFFTKEILDEHTRKSWRMFVAVRVKRRNIQRLIILLGKFSWILEQTFWVIDGECFKIYFIYILQKTL